MKIIIDCTYDNDGLPMVYHYFDASESPTNLVSNPEKDGEQIHATEFLSFLSDNADRRQRAGWDDVSRLPGLPEGTTRWQALLNQANHSATPQAIKDLALK